MKHLPCIMKLSLALVVFAILFFARSPLHAQEENPWKFLSDFEFIEGAVSPVQNGYIATVLQNTAKGLIALVIYPGECRAGNCVVGSPTAFIAVDSPGRIVKLHQEPGMKLESIIFGFQIS
jgi:hypothetical protein